MRRTLPVVVLATLVAGTTATSGAPPPPVERAIDVPFAGRSPTYVPRTAPRSVLLLVSGDDGWTGDTAALARRLAVQDVVVGVPLRALRRSAAESPDSCWYPAGDLEEIAHAAEKTLGLAEYRPPILAGVDAGASLVFAAIATGPAGTFAGGVSLGFRPAFSLRREVCPDEAWAPAYDRKTGVSRLPPQPALRADWFVLEHPGTRDGRPDVQALVTRSGPHAHLVTAGTRGGGWTSAVDALTASLGALSAPAGLPTRSAEAARSLRQLERDLDRLGLPLAFAWTANPRAFVVFLSGDGGWASLDQTVAARLASRGVAIVGLNSLKYFWRAKPPAQVAADVQAMIDVLATLGRPVYVGGYSFGAEAGAVALGRAGEGRAHVAGLLLVAPGPSASFEIDPLDWIRTPAADPATRVAPAVAHLRLPTLCIAGTDDDESACRHLNAPGRTSVVLLPGSHHFNGDYEAVARAIDAFIHDEGRR